MEFYLLRHGIAEDAQAGMTDADRALTDEGRTRLRNTLQVISRTFSCPTLIVSSPLLRAVQTAAIAAEEWGYTNDLATSSALEPGADRRDTWSEIRDLRKEARLLFASHNPLCAQVTGYLLGSPGLQVEFPKGGLVRIDFSAFGSEPKGVLRWMLTSKLSTGLHAA